jgi:multicomponent K+:H+ antiporter subunit D
MRRIGMTVFAGPLMRHAQSTAEQLLDPSRYIEQVRTTPNEIRAP